MRYPDQAELKRSYLWRSRWGLLAAVSGVLVVAGAVSLPFFHEQLLLDKRVARIFYFGAITAFFFWVVAAHKWSIYVVSRLYLKVRSDRRDPEKDNLGNEPCYYCGHSSAPIVCGVCGSIQWPGLSHNATGITDTKTNWAAGVFIAHHRFKLLAAGLSALFLGFLPSLVQIETERKVQEIQAIEREKAFLAGFSDLVLGDVINFRSSLLNVHDACVGGSARGTSSESKCAEERGSLMDSYVVFSWGGPQIMARTRQDHCQEPRTELQKTACGLLRRDLVDDLDEQFANLLEALDHEDPCEVASRAAHDLWFSSRRVACALVLAAVPAFYEESEIDLYPPSNRSCYEELKDVGVDGEWRETAGVDNIDLRDQGPKWLQACHGTADQLLRRAKNDRSVNDSG